MVGSGSDTGTCKFTAQLQDEVCKAGGQEGSVSTGGNGSGTTSGESSHSFSADASPTPLPRRPSLSPGKSQFLQMALVAEVSLASLGHCYAPAPPPPPPPATILGHLLPSPFSIKKNPTEEARRENKSFWETLCQCLYIKHHFATTPPISPIPTV